MNQKGRQVVSGKTRGHTVSGRVDAARRLDGSGRVREFRVASVTGRDNKPANNFLGMFALNTDVNAKNKRICTFIFVTQVR